VKHDQFDNLTRQLATSTSRRQALKTLGGAMLAGLFPVLKSRPVWGQTRRRGIKCKDDERCQKVLGSGSFCCNGVCLPGYSKTCGGVPGFTCPQCAGRATHCGAGGTCLCWRTVEGSVVCADTTSIMDCTTNEECQEALGNPSAVCLVGSCSFHNICGNTAACRPAG
jgi:hypothetical protein